MTAGKPAQRAKGLGLTRYFTGRPCPAGHIAERSVSNYQCVACANDARLRKYRADFAAGLIKKQTRKAKSLTQNRPRQPARE